MVVSSRGEEKDGSTRFCFDYRKLNAVTRKDAYPLPNMADTFVKLDGATYFSSLDLKAGYWQISIHPDDMGKTAFVVPGYGLHRFKVFSFGLCNAPATSQRLMETVLPLDECLVCLDDMIVPGRTFNDAFDGLRHVFLNYTV